MRTGPVGALNRYTSAECSMFVGHIGAGLALKRLEPRLNLGVLLFAALFADFLLWVLVIVGIESVGVPETAGAARYLTFTFPYSHGLAASVVWSGLAAGAGWLCTAPSASHRLRLAGALALAVLSHFVLDVLVHVPDLPIVSASSPRLGLGLWRHMPSALAVELALAAAAYALYWRSTRLTRSRTLLVGALVAVAAALTLAGPYVPGEPPPTIALAASSLSTLAIIVVMGFLAERRQSQSGLPGGSPI